MEKNGGKWGEMEGKWRKMEKNGQKWGIHEHIWIKVDIKISELWRRLGKIGEMMGKKRSQKEYGCTGFRITNPYFHSPAC